MKRITMTPGTVAPPEHRTDVFCSCSLCTQLAQAMANPDPDPGRGYRAAVASADAALGLRDIGWPPHGLAAADRSAALDELVHETEEAGGYAGQCAIAIEYNNRLGELAPDEAEPYLNVIGPLLAGRR
jgi:hypothetical protein